MKKSCSFIVFCCAGLFALTSSAQSLNESSFGAFLALPVGDFKSTDVQSGGFAKSGWGIVFDSKSRLKKLPDPWSLYFHSTYQWNEMDSEALSASFTQQLGMRTEVSDSKYSPLLTTIGPDYEFALGDKIKLAVHGTIGVLFSNTKAFTVKVFDSNNNVVVNELVNFNNQVAFAYSAGTELKFEIIKDVFGMALYTDYTAANQTTDLTFATAEPVSSFQSLNYFNTGIKFVLYKKQ